MTALLLVVHVAFLQASLPQVHEAQLVQGQSAFAAVRFAEALSLYEEALSQSQAPEGLILFNMGACAFRLHELPRARLFYERSRLRLPRDPQLLFNLQLVQEQLDLDEASPSTFLGRATAWLDALHPRTQLLLLGALQTVTLLGLVLLRRRRRLRLLMVLLVLLTLAASARMLHTRWSPPPLLGVVLKAEIAIHTQPAANQPVTERLKAGQLLRIAELSERWIRIETSRGGGWARRRGVGLVD